MQSLWYVVGKKCLFPGLSLTLSKQRSYFFTSATWSKYCRKYLIIKPVLETLLITYMQLSFNLVSSVF